MQRPTEPLGEDGLPAEGADDLHATEALLQLGVHRADRDPVSSLSGPGADLEEPRGRQQDGQHERGDQREGRAEHEHGHNRTHKYGDI